MYEEIEHIFRAYDIRGIYNQDLTPEIVARIGTAFGTLLDGEGTISIGKDVRTSSTAIENALTAGITSTGINVELLGTLPIQVTNWATWQENYKAGIVITASHNPPEYNGVRFRHSDGTGYIDIENEKVKEIFYKGDFKLAKWNKIGKIRQLDTKEIIHKYIDFALKHVKPERKMKVVLDLGNGAASYVAPKLFKEAGCEVITINEKPDGTFPGRSPDPLEDPLEELKKTVVREKAELGVAFDGDGDRAIMVDNLGKKVQTEKAGIIIAKYLLQRKRGKIVANISCSMIIEEELSKVGGEVVRCRVGDVFVSRTAKENKAIFGVEISAHYFLPIFGFYFDDAILASLLMTEILSKTERKLSQLLDEIPTYPLKRTNIPCPDKIKFKITEQLKEEHEEKGYKVDTTDGVKILLEDAWILIRPSNTESKIRMTIEARTTKKLNELFKQYTEKINDLIQQFR